jgi:hypothetical protein
VSKEEHGEEDLFLRSPGKRCLPGSEKWLRWWVDVVKESVEEQSKEGCLGSKGEHKKEPIDVDI